eukprot:1182377-Prorocentrum_minimum.AAC.2
MITVSAAPATAPPAGAPKREPLLLNTVSKDDGAWKEISADFLVELSEFLWEERTVMMHTHGCTCHTRPFPAKTPRFAHGIYAPYGRENRFHNSSAQGIPKVTTRLSQTGKIPTLTGQTVDLALLYNEVVKRGGEEKVTANKQWRDVAIAILGEQPVMKHTGTSTLMRKHYIKFLQDYEARCVPLHAITRRM